MKQIKVLLGCCILWMIWYYNQCYIQLGDLVNVDSQNIEAPMILEQDIIDIYIAEKEQMFERNTNKMNYKVETQKTTANEPIKDCIISIPKIDLERVVYTGVNREKELERYNLITAADNMTYKNGGNYIICGHNSRLYGHSLNRLHELKKGDNIYIHHQNKRHEYKVYLIQYQNMYQTSDYLQQTQNNELTILSCSKNRDKEEYIIVKCRFKN